MRKITQEEYNEAYDLHQLYLQDRTKGERLVFVDCDLRGVDFTGRKDLRHSNLSGSDLRHSNLRRSNLSGFNLRHSDLSHTDIYYIVGNMEEVVSMQLEAWRIAAKKDELAIGCKQYSWEKWESFSDDEISDMDDDALDFWRKWKGFIFEMRRLKFCEEY